MQKQTIRDLGERLDAHRKRQQQLHPWLTLTDMYNILEKLRTLDPSTEAGHPERGPAPLPDAVEGPRDNQLTAAARTFPPKKPHPPQLSNSPNTKKTFTPPA